MASVRRSLAFVSLALTLFLFCFAVCSVAVAAPPIVEEKSVGVNITESLPDSWCIAKPSANEVYLQDNFDFACKQENINCSVIQTDGSCHYPYNIVNHASVVTNLYYKMNNQKASACFFADTALTVLEDPSSASCVYA